MKKSLFVTAGLLLSTLTAFGALGDVVNSFLAPGRDPVALARAHNANYMWVYCINEEGTIHRINAYTGSVLSSFNSGLGLATRGLTYSYGGGGGLPSGSYLWMGSNWTYYIYRCNYNTGSVYASFPLYSSAIGGLAVKAIADGGYQPSCMFSSNSATDRIYHKNLITGSIQFLFKSYYKPYDLAWDWRNEIIWTGWAYNIVYGYTSSGSIVTSFTLPSNYPRGFCYYGEYLWIATLNDRRIWQVHCPSGLLRGGNRSPSNSNSNLVPASIGRIRAVYR